MNSIHVWQTELYDKKLDYVSEFGKGVVEVLSPKNGEKILDLGCGTGDLAYQISKAGATVIGMDLSTQMIDSARQKYPEINFFVGDAENFKLDEQVDAVFSNAALHWMKEPEQVIKCVRDALPRNSHCETSKETVYRLEATPFSLRIYGGLPTEFGKSDAK